MLKISDFLQQYFNAFIDEIVKEVDITDRKVAEYIFFKGFKIGYEFDYEILINLNEEVVTINNYKRNCPSLLKKFISRHLSNDFSKGKKKEVKE